ncbi:bifunctional 2-polyprenyl-6-hydroxyphenol methylase/3-demethylubiquinol 3-O-methyltransferase UbiG [Chitinophaga sp. XS-30]|uniref:class I SAM-dependent methyltransferase n=1 Tax=Chitinophaga sp. XS-30 TaxID=2604421 RepID=UPI0011DCBCFA|nr:class I SAM-dependent methyltransferase [Chitinophaga sp. XS-30]QEH43041.1 class I SAM-dependent methyltransferase [Chitinophaga sp. XS-30]
METVYQPLAFLQEVIAKGGPDTKEYDALNSIFDQLSHDYKCGRLSAGEMEQLQSGFDVEGMENTLHGHCRQKPFGYAGDFLIIDKIYRQHVSADRRFAKWDTYWNNQPATKAVRNRKDYFIRMILNRLSSAPLRLLNVASGPARDLAEVFTRIPSGALQATCVEADENAIAYATELNETNLQHIRFIHQNIFRFATDEQFDLVWSAGLFDYFEDSVFVKLLRKFISWTKPGGEVIIGNFSDQNPSRSCMELAGDWYLHHRSAESLQAMALEAGADRRHIRVGKELEGVNLFLHVRVGG